MNFQGAFDYLNNFSNYEKKAHVLKPIFSLDAIEKLLKKLGGPEKAYPSIHVAGTVGKGSVCHVTERTLRAAGYKTALYTSPHFVDVRERIKINGRMIPKSRFTAAVERLRDIVGDNYGDITYFEMMTGLAFNYFAEEKVDVAVVETGLGGRLDATNTVPPFVGVISKLGWDHVKVLGPRLSDIAAEKAGIIKSGGSVVCAPQSPSAARVIEDTCRDRKAQLNMVNIKDYVDHIGSEPGGERFLVRYAGAEPFEAVLPLAGNFQAMNLAVAVATLEAAAGRGLDIPEKAVRTGIEKVEFPGRMEMVKTPRGDILLDGAHNEPAAKALADALAVRESHRKVVLVAGMMRDKDSAATLRRLAAASDTIVLCSLPYDRAVPSRELAGTAQRYFRNVIAAHDMKSALAAARRAAPRGALVCVTGSLYAVAEAKLLPGLLK